MRPLFTLVSLVTLSVVLNFSPAIAHDERTRETTIGEITFSIPDGLSIEQVAAEPLVKWPIVADIDDQGRLVVAESAGVTSPITEHNSLKLHKIIRLVDDNHDGKFDRRIVAADEMTFPEGVLCVGNDILVAAPPVIWKLTDSDNDGVCEHREVWFDPGTLTHCANDLHGPYLGPDGWIYWCKGAFAEQTHTLADGRTIVSTAAHIFRRQISGGPIEMVIAGGMDNPVEVAFTPEGDMFFTSTFLHRPGGGLRDGIANGVYGGLFGKDHAVLDNQTRTGALLPVMTELGPAAPSGLACLRSNRILPTEPGDRELDNREPRHRTLVATQFNRQRVSVHQLVPDGATFRTIDQNLVVADRIDFHPTDVLEDADGSLIILDTGGWYDLCCPTSRVNQKTAAGGIYRIKNVKSPALATEDATDQSLDRLWELSKVGTPETLASVATELNSSAPSTAIVALRIMALHRSSQWLDSIHRRLRDPNPAVARAAAEAVGRCGDGSSADLLLQAMDTSHQDRFLEHSIIYALIELKRREPALNLIELAASPSQLNAALLATDQSALGDPIPLVKVHDALASEYTSLRETAVELLARHVEWAPESTHSLDNRIQQLTANSTHADALLKLLVAWKYDETTQATIATWLGRASSLNATQQAFLAQHLAEFSPPELPTTWVDPILRWIESCDPTTRSRLADNVSQLTLGPHDGDHFSASILKLAEANQDIALLAMLPTGIHVGPAWFEKEVIAKMASGTASEAVTAAKVLCRVTMSPDSANGLCDELSSIAPTHFTVAIEAIQRIGDEQTNLSMLGKLKDLPQAKTLAPDYLVRLYAKSTKTLRHAAAEANEALAQPPADIRDAVAAKLKSLGTGDPLRGLQVFHGKKANCGSCHQMGYVGGNVGPELTRIGSSRTAEALMEAILFPSARMEQSFRSTQILTVDGKVLIGLIKRQDAKVIELQVAADRVQRVNIDDIETSQPSDLSVMPTGLAEQLTLDELSDLFALLQSAK